ncbi:MAG: hypothetical protein JW955_07910 [Sedimentisphaerales bacterium]|nr:hypothetical protein [Sedimentisphaerales bacterium]
MRRVWAVARNTIRQALRMKVAAAFVALLLILLPILGLTVTGDGTLKGRLQTFVSYGFSLTSLLLSFLTIIVSIYTITSDIEHRQIYTVITKPIRRSHLILGKLLGVITLDIALLTLFAGIIYAVAVFMPRFLEASPQELDEIDRQFYTARASLVPPDIDVSEEVNATYERLVKNDQLNLIYPNYTKPDVIKALTNQQRLAKRAAAVGQRLVWEFKNVRPLNPNQSLFIRFKYNVSVTPPDEQAYGDWYVGDLRQLGSGPELATPIYRDTRKDPIDKFREIEVPAAAVAKDGYLAVGFINPQENQTVVIFPLEDGLEILYKADTFTANFIRAAILVVFRLIFLACLGALAGSFLSFPVAILFCLVIFLTGTVSGFVMESFDSLSKSIGLFYTYTVKGLIQLLPQFDKNNPTTFLVPARIIGWGFVAKAALLMVGLRAFLLLVFAVIIFSFRELAKVVV